VTITIRKPKAEPVDTEQTPPEGRPLEQGVITVIRTRHNILFEGEVSHSESLRELIIFYRASDGQPFMPETLEQSEQAHRFIVLSSHHQTSEAELQMVRILPSGEVWQPQGFGTPAPTIDLWDTEDKVAEPAPKWRPASTIGGQVARIILARHEKRVPRQIREPGLGSERDTRGFVLPPETLLYAQDGQYVGSLADPDNREHSEVCVRLSTHSWPSPEQLASTTVGEHGEVADVEGT
jgi:hypothetical protein